MWFCFQVTHSPHPDAGDGRVLPLAVPVQPLERAAESLASHRRRVNARRATSRRRLMSRDALTLAYVIPAASRTTDALSTVSETRRCVATRHDATRKYQVAVRKNIK